MVALAVGNNIQISGLKTSRKKIAVVMGSQSDYATMRQATQLLKEFSIKCEERILSAHRTPERLRKYAQNAEKNGVSAIIAGAGGAAHLPGMLAAETPIPVYAVPIGNSKVGGLDSLLSIAQMPKGVPVATFSIDGAHNAALFAIAVLAQTDAKIKKSLQAYRKKQTDSVPIKPIPIPETKTNGAYSVVQKKDNNGFRNFIDTTLQQAKNIYKNEQRKHNA